MNLPALIATTIAVCIFSFKLIIVPFGESGIRVDDLVILGCFLYSAAHSRYIYINTPPPLRVYIWFMVWQLLCALLAAFGDRVNAIISVVFVVRLAEYAAFFLFGYLITISKPAFMNQLMTGYALFLIILVPLQSTGIAPTLSPFGQIRASGNANGPYELAVVASFLLFYLQGQRLVLAVKAGTLIVLMATAARITIFAHLILSLILLIRKGSKLAIPFLVAIVTLYSAYLAFFEETINRMLGGVEVIERFQELEGQSPIADFQTAYRAVPIYSDSASYEAELFRRTELYSYALDGDASANIRIVRWASLIKSTLDSLQTTIVGLGPSFGTAAVDGYYVRVFIESGVIGIAMFCIFTIVSLKYTSASAGLFCYFCVLLLTGAFIDIFVSYKPMILFWLWLGQLSAERQTGNKTCT